MDEKTKDQRKRGVFSGREIFYFFFVLLVFGVLAFVFTVGSSDWREQRARERAAKLARSREAAQSIAARGGYVISDTQVLYHDAYHHPANPWVVYDLKKDEITDGRYLVRALEVAGLYQDTPTNEGFFSGWKGNLVFAANVQDFGAWIFQWRTNSEELQVSKWVELGGRRSPTPPHVLAVENGWFVGSAYNKPPNGSVRVVWAGNLNGPMPYTNLVLANLNKTNLLVSNPFQQGLYITVATPDRLHADIYIFSPANQSLIFSNDAVKMPRAFDYIEAMPDPSGKRVLWIFGVESKINAKLRSILPDAIAPGEAPTKWYLYSSDLHATKFTFVCEPKQNWYSEILWGSNGDSIWLLYRDEGIKRIELK